MRVTATEHNLIRWLPPCLAQNSAWPERVPSVMGSRRRRERLWLVAYQSFFSLSQATYWGLTTICRCDFDRRWGRTVEPMDEATSKIPLMGRTNQMLSTIAKDISWRSLFIFVWKSSPKGEEDLRIWRLQCASSKVESLKHPFTFLMWGAWGRFWWFL